MDEITIKRAIESAVRETIHLVQRTNTPQTKLQALAIEYAEQLIMPVVCAAVEEAREDGYQDGRRVAAPVVVA